jgi:predicted ATP-dependent serine protease
MIVISGGRGIGKTRLLLEQAAASGGTVVCAAPDAMRVRAYKYGITGLNIISYNELGVSETPVYIHDINKFLSNNFGNVKGYSQCTE